LLAVVYNNMVTRYCWPSKPDFSGIGYDILGEKLQCCALD